MPIFTPKAYSNDVARTGALRLRLVDEALPGLRERLQLPLVEVTQEEVAHAGEMRGARRGQRTGTIRREAGVEDATILRARLADDQATLLQKIGKALIDRNRHKAETLSVKLVSGARLTNAIVVSFGFHYCRFEPSKYT